MVLEFGKILSLIFQRNSFTHGKFHFASPGLLLVPFLFPLVCPLSIWLVPCRNGLILPPIFCSFILTVFLHSTVLLMCFWCIHKSIHPLVLTVPFQFNHAFLHFWKNNQLFKYDVINFLYSLRTIQFCSDISNISSTCL